MGSQSPTLGSTGLSSAIPTSQVPEEPALQAGQNQSFSNGLRVAILGGSRFHPKGRLSSLGQPPLGCLVNMHQHSLAP